MHGDLSRSIIARAWHRSRPLATGLSLLGLWGCGLDGAAASREDAARITTGGDAARGRELVSAYGCVACHSIAGVPGADRRVAPPLTGIGGRMFIAGVLPNEPENLILWIRDPRGVDSLTAMPDVGASERDARDMAAFLYTLE